MLLSIIHQTIRVLKQMLYYIALISFYLPSKELRAYDLENVQVSTPSLERNVDILSKYCLQDKNSIIVCSVGFR